MHGSLLGKKEEVINSAIRENKKVNKSSHKAN